MEEVLESLPVLGNGPTEVARRDDNNHVGAGSCGLLGVTDRLLHGPGASASDEGLVTCCLASALDESLALRVTKVDGCAVDRRELGGVRR